MHINTENFETKADYDRVTLALRQERSETGSEREFKITEYYQRAGDAADRRRSAIALWNGAS